MSRLRMISAVLAASLAVTACTQASVSIEDVPELPHVDPNAVAELLAASERPVVLNVWASWCTPCRSEAPLLRSAAARHESSIRFVGVAVKDVQNGAREFIAEFGLDGFEHFFDPAGAVPAALGGVGVPLTFFFEAGGRLVTTHSGVIDERALALQIDELLGRSG